MHLPDHPAPEQRIADEWETANLLPPDQRETALDLLLIRHGPALRATLRDRVIAAAEPGKVISLADRRSKLPRGL